MDPPQGRLGIEIDIVLGERTGKFDIRLCVNRKTAQSNREASSLIVLSAHARGYSQKPSQHLFE
jgi:hypothetical protein